MSSGQYIELYGNFGLFYRTALICLESYFVTVCPLKAQVNINDKKSIFSPLGVWRNFSANESLISKGICTVIFHCLSLRPVWESSEQRQWPRVLLQWETKYTFRPFTGIFLRRLRPRRAAASQHYQVLWLLDSQKLRRPVFPGSCCMGLGPRLLKELGCRGQQPLGLPGKWGQFPSCWPDRTPGY